MQKAKRILAMCLVLCMLLSVLPVSALAITITDKPANGRHDGGIVEIRVDDKKRADKSTDDGKRLSDGKALR